MIDFDMDNKLNTILENADLLSFEEKVEIAKIYNKIEAEKEKNTATNKGDLSTAKTYDLYVESLNEASRYESLYESLNHYAKSRNLKDLQITPSALLGFIQIDMLNAQRKTERIKNIVKALQTEKEQE